MAENRKTPCSDCPFRRTSLRGYLGPHADTAEIVGILYADQKFPCHVEVNALVNPPDGRGMTERKAFAEASHCAGGLMMLRNDCKLSRDRETAVLQRQLGRSEEVFANRREMAAWHDHPTFAKIRAVVIETVGPQPARRAAGKRKGRRT